VMPPPRQSPGRWTGSTAFFREFILAAPLKPRWEQWGYSDCRITGRSLLIP
jgi:hypothetical protein